MALAPGTKLDGYEILGLLGSGGMGEVYRARDPVLKREVAIKVLPSFVSQNPEELRRFEQEAQAAAALNHPNILAVYRFGVFDGAPYLVSELLDGSTLRDLLERGPLPLRKTIDLGVQAAHGLAAAHEKGIVHRDLKPENLFVSKDGRVKILDFGLAKLIHRQAAPDGQTRTQGTDPGTVVGTVGYMAPEQVRGDPADHRADIFAFGATLYEMLAGTRAFRKPTSAETLVAILNEDPPAVSQVVTPPWLQRVVHRCLEKNPEQRFQSASDLAFALDASADSGTLSGVAVVQVKRPVSRMAILWSGAAAILALAAVAYFALSRQNSAASLRISEYTQITRDGHTGQVLGTDGSRLYLSQGIQKPMMQVSVSGGEIEPVSMPVLVPYVEAVSPDGSTLLVESLAGGLTAPSPLWTVRVLGGSPHYLIDNSAGAIWSPDGKSILYLTQDGDLNLMQNDGTGIHKLATVGNAGSLSWSPDGKSIRFYRDNSLWEMSSGGTNLHQLLSGWKPPSRPCCGAWSPDGSFFFFRSGLQIWFIDERQQLFGKPHDQPVQLTSGPTHWGYPVPGKDGHTIFANGSTANGELVRFDPKSNQFQQFLGGISADSVSFSKDGSAVAYVSFPDGILWKADRDGSNRIQLSSPPLYPRLPVWSPDGTQIVFKHSTAPGHTKAYVVSSQGGSPRLLFPDDAGEQTDPNWSPDGRKIVFSTTDGGGEDNGNISVLDLASRKIAVLPGSAGMYSPRWSPDGRSIASQSSGGSALHVFDIGAQRWSVLYKGLLAFPNWSHDSKSIFFLKYTGDRAVLRVPVGGGEAQRLIDLKNVDITGHVSIWLGLDPADSPLVLRNTGTSDIYALTLERK